MNEQEIELKRGQLLVITGGQGSGKSTLARKLAEKEGAYKTVQGVQLDVPQTFPHWYRTSAGDVKALVIEGAPEKEQGWDTIKAILCSDLVEFEVQLVGVVSVPSPYLIMCLRSEMGFEFRRDLSRRMRVVQLPDRVIS